MRAIIGVTAALVLAPAAAAQAPGEEQPAATVNANGNAFTGGLSFDPDHVTVGIGAVVEWVNTDFLVPHTATEDHGLWDLGGDYGATPLTPPGFGPGTRVKRHFEAGTAHYYCRVHPTQMKAVVAVPVDLRLIGLRKRVHKRKRVVRYVVATWAIEAPAKGQVFDVEVSRGSGAFTPLRAGTTQTGALLRAGKRGTVTHVRARLRSAADPAKATDWSPDTAVASDQHS